MSSKGKRTRQERKPRLSRRNKGKLQKQCVVVALGASAGGLDAFRAFFRRMPPDTGMAFVLVQHLEPTRETLMPELLAKHTSMPVQQLKDRTRLEANHVYAGPPKSLLSVQNCAVRVKPARSSRPALQPIDHFFASLAEDQGALVIGIILSGAGSDGTLGLKAVKEYGGLTLAQKPATAKYDSMPRSAIASGFVDEVLEAEEMPQRISTYVSNLVRLQESQGFGSIREGAGKELAKVFAILLRHTGHDFSRYKQSTLIRRIQRRMRVCGLSSFAAYVRALRKERGEVDLLLRDLLIGVTQFFRDEEAFELLAREIIPELWRLKKSNDPLRVWVPGCATGEEAYSIAILLVERAARLNPPPKIQIFGTDIDEEAIEFARKGRYPASIVEQVTRARLKRFFIKRGGHYELTETIRELCVFSPHNLIRDPPFSRLDLISCRNLLIYLEADVQKKLLGLFHYALKAHGYLFLGPSENIASRSEFFRPVDKKHRVFQRKPSIKRVLAAVPIAAGGARSRPASQAAVLPNTGHETNAVRTIERLLIEDYAPSGVVVNDHGEVIYFCGRTGDFLEAPAGVPSYKIVNMAPRSLRHELRLALNRVVATRREVVRPDITLRIRKSVRNLTLIVRPLPELGRDAGLYLVIFQEAAPAQKSVRKDQRAALRPNLPVVAELESELRTTREELQSAIEELENSNEELKSANEELLSMNEELQSTNEELQTSKEELQSLNEELQGKIEELDVAHGDLQNLFQTSGVAILFLDEQLRIRKVTAAAGELFGIGEREIGRPLLSVASQLAPYELDREVIETLQSGRSRKKEVGLGDHWFLMRVHPYRTVENRVDGVVVSLSDVTDLKKAQAEAARLAAVVTSSEDAIISKTLDGTITSWNRAAEKIYGYSAEEVLGRPISIIVPPDLENELPSILERLRNGERLPLFETARLRKGGARIAVALTVSPIHDSEGRVVGASAIARNITESKRTEAALRRSEQELSDFFNNAAVGLHWVGPEGTILRVNRTELDTLGYQAHEYIGRHIAEFHVDQPVIKDILERLARGETLREHEARMRCKDGSIKHVLIDANVLFENGQFVHTRCFTRDITARKEAQAALRESQERLRFTLEATRVGTWEWDIVTGKVEWSENLARIHGMDLGQFGGTFESFLADVHPDDRQRVQQAIDHALTGTDSYYVEYRLPARTAQRERWMEGRGRVIHDSAGQPIRMAGICTEITDRKHVEQSLRESERRLDGIISSAMDAIITVGSNQRIVLFNPAAERMFQCPPSEALGQPIDRFIPERFRHGHGQHVRAFGVTGVSNRRMGALGTIWGLRADGEEFPIEAAISQIELSGEKFFTVILRDVTARQRAEEGLRQQAQTLQTLNETGATLAAELDLEKLLQAVTDAGTKLSGAQFGAFFYNVVDERGEAYTLYVVSGVPREAFSKFPMPRNTALFGPTFRGEGAIRIADVLQDSRYGQNPPHRGMPPGHLPVRSYLAVPVVSRSGEVIGGLFFGHPEPGIFTEQSEELTEGLAGQAAIAVDNARLYQAAQSELVERRKVESALSRSEERYRSLATATTSIIWTTDPEGRFVEPQPSWENYTGQRWEEHRDLGWLMAVHADDREMARDLWNQARQAGSIYHSEGRLWNAARGEFRYFVARGVPVHNTDGGVREWIGTVTDVHEQKRAEVALRQSEERYRNIFEGAGVGIWEEDFSAVKGLIDELKAEGVADFNRHLDEHPELLLRCLELVKLLDVNPEGLKLFGAKTKEELLRSLNDIFVPETLEMFKAELMAIAAARPFLEMEAPLQTLQGQRKSFWISVSFATYETNLDRVFVSLLDITERKGAEEALREAQEALREHADQLERRVEERTAKLQETVQSLDSFCYSIAHDLRAPLRGMTGLSTALLEDYSRVLDGVGQDYARRIVRAGLHMDRLIQDLLAYGRLSHEEVSCSAVDLSAHLQLVLAQMAAEIEAHQAVIEAPLPLPSVWAHPTVLNQVLINLITNAIKFVGEAVHPHVRIRAEDRGESIRLHVQDNGIGIPADHHERIFRVFERLHNTDRFPGTGIGLAIVRKGIERMDGRLGLTSEPGKGSCFWIELPKPPPA